MEEIGELDLQTPLNCTQFSYNKFKKAILGKISEKGQQGTLF